MKTQNLIKRARKPSKPFRVANRGEFRLKDFDPGDTLGLKSEDKPRANPRQDDRARMGVFWFGANLLYANEGFFEE